MTASLTTAGLLDPNAEHRFLRPHLAYKRTWPYYLAMILDPLLRFNWVFYIAFPVELQHSAILSFIVAISEVCRRGMWTLFRVENEHCTNVGRFRASRDVPLPYKIKGQESQSSAEALLREHQRDANQKDQELIAEAGGLVSEHRDGNDQTAADRTGISAVGGASVTRGGTGGGSATGVDIERQHVSDVVQSLRRRQASGVTQQSAWAHPGQTIRERIGQIMRRAHAQDFERRRTDEDEIQHEDSEEEDEQHEEDEEQASDAEDLEFDRDELQRRGQRAAEGMRSPWGRGHDGSGGERNGFVERQVDSLDRRDIREAEEFLARAANGEGH